MLLKCLTLLNNKNFSYTGIDEQECKYQRCLMINSDYDDKCFLDGTYSVLSLDDFCKLDPDDPD